jgi:endonuclease YncB( thermonuclease family)
LAYPPTKRRVAAILLFPILWPLPALAADFPDKVVGISDGDTLTVLTAETWQVKVRLHGIDAPETGQDFGSRAKQAASEAAFGKQVTVREVDRDCYGRTVAEVIQFSRNDFRAIFLGWSCPKIIEVGPTPSYFERCDQ